jgi:hypothetical protein
MERALSAAGFFHSPEKLEHRLAVAQAGLFAHGDAVYGSAGADCDRRALVAGRKGHLRHMPLLGAVRKCDFDGNECDGQASRAKAKGRCVRLRRRDLEGYEVRAVVDARLPENF